MATDMLDIESPTLGISVGDTHTLAINSKSHLFSWGSNDYGQCGIKACGYVPYDKKTKVKIPNVNARIKEIACGSTHSLALDYEGNVYSWGNDQKGQLGSGYLFIKIILIGVMKMLLIRIKYYKDCQTA